MREGTIYDTADADIVVVIQDGVARVVKHRWDDPAKVEAEVKLTTRIERSATYGPKPQDTLGLAPEAELRLTRKVAVTPDQIRVALDAAIARGASVRISGRKVDGARYVGRQVAPRSIETLRIDGSEYLHCRDLTKEGHRAHRAFSLDGIERVEWEDE